MPAIRFIFNGIMSRATMTPDRDTGQVEIRMHNGRIQRFPWMGFICKSGIAHMTEGAYAKMLAAEVTNGDGFTYGDWVRVEENQFVLTWRVPSISEGRWGIFGVVDNSGWPVVMTDKNYKPPRKPNAKLYSIERSSKIEIPAGKRA